jgi:hypothetical protein
MDLFGRSFGNQRTRSKGFLCAPLVLAIVRAWVGFTTSLLGQRKRILCDGDRIIRRYRDPIHVLKSFRRRDHEHTTKIGRGAARCAIFWRISSRWCQLAPKFCPPTLPEGKCREAAWN